MVHTDYRKSAQAVISTSCATPVGKNEKKSEKAEDRIDLGKDAEKEYGQ